MSTFEEYIRQGEPGRSAKAAAWQTAIGLQDVDGLQPSEYLGKRLLKANPKTTQEQLAEHIHRSPRTAKSLTSRLTEKGYLIRRNGKRDGWWEVLTELPEE